MKKDISIDCDLRKGVDASVREELGVVPLEAVALPG